jgi:hypothetical protein
MSIIVDSFPDKDLHAFILEGNKKCIGYLWLKKKAIAWGNVFSLKNGLESKEILGY